MRSQVDPTHYERAIHTACMNNRLDEVKNLLNEAQQKNLIINLNRFHDTARGFYSIHWAIEHKNLDLVTFLLEHNANPRLEVNESKKRIHDVPINLALERKQYQIMFEILKSIDERNLTIDKNLARHVIFILSKETDTQAIEHVIKKLFKILRDEKRREIKSRGWASDFDFYDYSNASRVGSKRFYTLHYAIINKNVQLVKELLNFEINPNKNLEEGDKENFEGIPIIIALQNKQTEIVSLLAADPNIYLTQEIIQLIIFRFCERNENIKYLESIFNIAEKKNIPVVLNRQYSTDTGYFSLHHAINKKNAKAVALLLKKGADPNLLPRNVTDENKKPINMALDTQQLDVVLLFLYNANFKYDDQIIQKIIIALTDDKNLNVLYSHQIFDYLKFLSAVSDNPKFSSLIHEALIKLKPYLDANVGDKSIDYREGIDELATSSKNPEIVYLAKKYQQYLQLIPDKEFSILIDPTNKNAETKFQELSAREDDAAKIAIYKYTRMLDQEKDKIRSQTGKSKVTTTQIPDHYSGITKAMSGLFTRMKDPKSVAESISTLDKPSDITKSFSNMISSKLKPEKIFENLKLMADAGNRLALLELGNCYAQGYGIQNSTTQEKLSNRQEAIKCYLKAGLGDIPNGYFQNDAKKQLQAFDFMADQLYSYIISDLNSQSNYTKSIYESAYKDYNQIFYQVIKELQLPEFMKKELREKLNTLHTEELGKSEELQLMQPSVPLLETEEKVKSVSTQTEDFESKEKDEIILNLQKQLLERDEQIKKFAAENNELKSRNFDLEKNVKELKEMYQNASAPPNVDFPIEPNKELDKRQSPPPFNPESDMLSHEKPITKNEMMELLQMFFSAKDKEIEALKKRVDELEKSKTPEQSQIGFYKK